MKGSLDMTLLERLRGLIVEDDIPTAKGLQLEFRNALPGTQVDVVHAVDPALQLLDQSLLSGKPYDFAIIDFKLPQVYGGNSDPDFKVSRSFESLSRDTILIHCTAYKNDLEIRQFLSHRDASAAAGRLCIAKEGGDWPRLLIKELLRSLHSRRVRKRLDTLFGRHEVYGRCRLDDRGKSHRTRAIHIADLCADASQHWGSLTESLQNDLKHTLGYTSLQRGDQTLHVLGVASKSNPEPRQDVV